MTAAQLGRCVIVSMEVTTNYVNPAHKRGKEKEGSCES